MKHIYILLLLIIGLFQSCKQNPKAGFGTSISTDIKEIENGRRLFALHCSSCHNFKQNGIGPNLSGLTRKVKTSWISEFIKYPSKMILEKDDRTMALMKKYLVPMPGFDHINEADIHAILGYMHTFNESSVASPQSSKVLENPIKDSLLFSPVTASLEFIIQIAPSSEESPLARINKMECAADSGRLFINDLRGALFEITENKANVFMALNELEENFISKPGLGTGFGSFAFHPDFQKNGLLYTTHSEPKETQVADFTFSDSIPKTLQWVIKEWKLDNPKSRTFSGTSRELMRIDFVSGIHGMQEIAFNPTVEKGDTDYGMLYIGLGDGGSVENGYKEVAHHDGRKVWGSILRIDPRGNTSTNGNYGIPKDNPFKTMDDKAKEVWAFGFRNPNKIIWDAAGNMFSSDIGHAQIEELNRITPGKFYGWPIREGTFRIDPDGNLDDIYDLPKNDLDYKITYPVIQYDHTEGAAISGGFVAIKGALSGKYIFGDIPTGNLFISDLETGRIEKLKVSLNNKIMSLGQISKSKRVDLKLGKDCAGSIYLFTKADGKIYRIVD